MPSDVPMNDLPNDELALYSSVAESLDAAGVDRDLSTPGAVAGDAS